MNKHIYLLIGLTVLLCSMLACMTTVEPLSTYPPDDTPTAGIDETSEPESGAVFELQPTTTAEFRECATVTATLSLNIREKPSTQARVLGYLENGELVHVLGKVSAWWLINPKNKPAGYVDSQYLAESECE